MKLSKKKQIEEQLKILEETKKFYFTTSRRAIVQDAGPFEDNCLFLTEDGKRCALSRYIPLESDVLKQVIKEGFNNGGTIENVKEFFSYDKKISSSLVFQLAELFWTHLQVFHDQDENWNKKRGLTPKGKTYFEGFKKEIKAGKFVI